MESKVNSLEKFDYESKKRDQIMAWWVIWGAEIHLLFNLFISFYCF